MESTHRLALPRRYEWPTSFLELRRIPALVERVRVGWTEQWIAHQKETQELVPSSTKEVAIQSLSVSDQSTQSSLLDTNTQKHQCSMVDSAGCLVLQPFLSSTRQASVHCMQILDAGRQNETLPSPYIHCTVRRHHNVGIHSDQFLFENTSDSRVAEPKPECLNCARQPEFLREETIRLTVRLIPFFSARIAHTHLFANLRECLQKVLWFFQSAFWCSREQYLTALQLVHVTSWVSFKLPRLQAWQAYGWYDCQRLHRNGIIAPATKAEHPMEPIGSPYLM